MQARRAVLIAGPTASGKSAVALALAERLGGTVINTDSMQVYGDLRVLTARPTPEEETRAPHRLYGHVPAAESYSVGRWIEDARAAIAEAEAQGRLPILVGGTGLYFKALLEGLSPVPDTPEPVRRRWREAAAAMGAGELHKLLAERDPEMAARLRPSDPQRLVRALEVIEATGRSLAYWQRVAGKPVLERDRTARVVLAPERAQSARGIEARFAQMIAQGALAEVAALKAQALDPALPALRAHGVPALMAHLEGRISLEEAGEWACTDTRRYAKRQKTWARRYMADWAWVSGPEEALDRLGGALV